MAANGTLNFEANPDYTIAAVQARMDTLRDTVRVARNALGPLQRGEQQEAILHAIEPPPWPPQWMRGAAAGALRNPLCRSMDHC